MTTEALNEAVLGLIKTITTNPENAELEWESISIVGCTRPGQDFVHRMYGYIYLADDIESVKLVMEDMDPFYEQLMTATIPEDEDGWQKCLLQFDNTGRSNLLFEFVDESRWTINPSDLGLLPEEIRPNFVA